MSKTGLVYESPVHFTRRQRLVLGAGAFLAASAVKLICRSCRLEVRNLDAFNRAKADSGHVHLAAWHETLGMAAWRHRNSGAHTLTSYSFDGELAARVVAHFGLCALRGSSSRGGREALHQLTLAARQVDVTGITLDGPKGPRRQAKPGIAILSARSRMPVVPSAFAASRAWRMNSWDRLVIPKPFARIICVYGEPIFPPEKANRNSIETFRKEIETRLNRLHDELEQELGAGKPASSE